MSPDTEATDGLTTPDDRDWREWAYLTAENWPEAIPNSGPHREYGPWPWSSPTHDDPHGVDRWPASHPDAASVGHSYMGDVCPYCGVPLNRRETVVLIDGMEGQFAEINPVAEPEPAYHPECWSERQHEVASADPAQTQLSDL